MEAVYEARRWLWIGLAIMFVLIGVAALLSVLLPGRSGLAFGWTPPGTVWGWLWTVFGVLVLLWILSWFFRFAFWRGSWGSGGRYYGGWRHQDSAAAIARERYARGELSRDQYDQLIRDLEK